MNLSTIVLLLMSSVLSSNAASRNRNNVSLPLIDNMKAALTANIDMREMNSVLEDYIDRTVEERVLASVNGTVSTMHQRMKELQRGVTNTLAAAHDANVTTHYSNIHVQSLSETKALLLVMDDSINRLSEKVSELESRSNSDDNRCAFLAGLNANKNNLPADAVVVFDDVKLNVGGCYSGSSGKFTANSDGLYVFSWTTLTADKQDFTSIIVKNGDEIVVNVVDSDSVSDFMTGSSTVIIDMKKGDNVWLKVYSSEGDTLQAKWGISASTFTGFST